MKVWIILGLIVLALLLLSLVRMGIQAEYSETGFLLKAKLGPFKLTLYPRKAKKPKKDKAQGKQKKAKKPKEPAPQKGGSLALVKTFLPLIGEAAGQMKRKIRIDVLHLDLVAAAGDPAAAAMAFGGANAAVGMIWPLLEQNFQIKDRRIRTAVDFNARSPVIYLFAQATLTIGQAVAFGGRLGVRFLKLFMEYRAGNKSAPKDQQSKQKQKEAV